MSWIHMWPSCSNHRLRHVSIVDAVKCSFYYAILYFYLIYFQIYKTISRVLILKGESSSFSDFMITMVTEYILVSTGPGWFIWYHII